MRLRRTPGVRRETTQTEYALRGLIIIVVVAAVLGFMALRQNGTLGGPDQVYADLNNAGGSLVTGSDVKVRGVIVGHVSRIEPGTNTQVRVTLDLDGDDLDHIPAEVVARILPATVFGTSFVDLVADHSTGQALADGAIVPADQRQGTLELQQALDDIDTLVKAVGPADLSSALGSAAQALDGRGQEIGATIDLANAFLSKINPKMPLIRDDLHKLAANLELIEQVAPDLLRATDDALLTARTTVEQQDALNQLLSAGTGLTIDATTFLHADSADLTRFIDNAARLLHVVYLNRHAGITEAVLTNRMLNAKLSSAIENGYINGSGTLLNLDVPPYYTAVDCPRFGRAHGDNCPSSQ